MYGLVNRAIEEMVLEEGGIELWQAIKEKAGVDEITFLSMQPYPDSITYELVASASEVLGVMPEDLLRQFGRHWIMFTAQEGYGSLLQSSGRDVREFLHNLDAMHARIASTMTELNPPSFKCIEINSANLHVYYSSERSGLEPMVVGLLEGLGELYETPLKVTLLEGTSGDCGTIFNVQFINHGIAISN